MNYNDAQAAIHTIEGTIAEWQAQRAAKLAEVRDQLPMIDTLLGTLHTQLAEAKRHAQVARIATMREQAQALRVEGKSVLAQREELLKQLELLDGPLYMASPRSHGLLHQAELLERGAFALELTLNREPADPKAKN